MAAHKVHYSLNYYSGEPYVGTRKDEIKAKNERVTELELENKRLRSRIAALEARYIVLDI